MKREDKISFVRIKLLEGWKDKDIRKEKEIPESAYFYWKDLIKNSAYINAILSAKP